MVVVVILCGGCGCGLFVPCGPARRYLTRDQSDMSHRLSLSLSLSRRTAVCLMSNFHSLRSVLGIAFFIRAGGRGIDTKEGSCVCGHEYRQSIDISYLKQTFTSSGKIFTVS